MSKFVIGVSILASLLVLLVGFSFYIVWIKSPMLFALLLGFALLVVIALWLIDSDES